MSEQDWASRPFDPDTPFADLLDRWHSLPEAQRLDEISRMMTVIHLALREDVDAGLDTQLQYIVNRLNLLRVSATFPQTSVRTRAAWQHGRDTL